MNLRKSPVPSSGQGISLAVKLGLFIFAVLLFFLSFPSPLSDRGWGYLVFLAPVPVFLLVRSVSWGGSVIWGGLYSGLSYALFNLWLLSFHPVAFQIVPAIYFFYGLVLFPFLKLLGQLDLPWRPWALAFGWTAYEYLKTQGFLGYSYGVLGYALWEDGVLIQSAAWGGVWALSLLVTSAAALGAEGLRFLIFPPQSLKDKGSQLLLPGVLLGLYAGFMVVWGLVSPLDLEPYPRWRPALVQHDVDPWKDGDALYRQGTGRLLELSRRALAAGPDALVWPETAVIPSLMYHLKYREDSVRFQTVEDVLDFAEETPVPLILGNGHGERRTIPGGDGRWERVDYNSVFLFFPRGGWERYDKVHLVPFTEHFPFGGPLEPLKNYLESADTHFWESGQTWKVFRLPEVGFSTPICFEDTFGYISREFVRGGADVLVNLTNDSWSGVKPNMYQHFAISVFRAVENRRSLVRSTAGGITAAVDPNGKILGELTPYTQGVLMEEVPVVQDVETFYTRWGDWLGILSLSLGILGIIIASVGLAGNRS